MATPILAIVHSPIPTIRHGLISMLNGDPEIEATAPGGLADVPDGIGTTVDVIHVTPAGLTSDDDATLEISAAAVLVLEAQPVELPELDSIPIALVPTDSEADVLTAATRAVAQGLTVIDWELARSSGIGWRLPPTRLAGDDEPLTPREREVIELVAQGLPNKAIAVALGISEHTVKFHMGSLMSKLGAESRTEAVTTATRRGILTI